MRARSLDFPFCRSKFKRALRPRVNRLDEEPVALCQRDERAGERVAISCLDGPRDFRPDCSTREDQQEGRKARGSSDIDMVSIHNKPSALSHR